MHSHAPTCCVTHESYEALSHLLACCEKRPQNKTSHKMGGYCTPQPRVLEKDRNFTNFFHNADTARMFFPHLSGLSQIGCWISFVYSLCRFRFWSLGSRVRIAGSFFSYWVFGIVAKCESTAKNMPKQQKNATCPNIPDLNLLRPFAQIKKIWKTCLFGCFCAFPEKTLQTADFESPEHIFGQAAARH